LKFRGHVLIWPSYDKENSYHKIPKFVALEEDVDVLEERMVNHITAAINAL
jgi:hypothetical protein